MLLHFSTVEILLKQSCLKKNSGKSVHGVLQPMVLQTVGHDLATEQEQ